MGQAMACCGKSEIDSNDVKTNDFTNAYKQLKHSDKIKVIVRIQAFVRGCLARKRVQKLREYRGVHPGMGNYQMSPDGVQNFENPDVIAIREQLGDFDYGQE
jgi:hypothetical protein